MRADEGRTLVIERTDRPRERFAVELDESLVNGGFYDLAKTDMRLQRGKVYTVTLGDRKFTFKVDAKAKTGNTPLISRLLRFPPELDVPAARSWTQAGCALHSRPS